MDSKVAFIFLSGLVCVMSQGSIDPTQCQEISGGFGSEIYCPTGTVAVGACGSGRNEDCAGGASHILKCCAVVGVDNKQMACSGAEGNHGQEYECPQGQQIISLCGSGENQDCGAAGADISAKSTCCDGNGITTGESSFCRWSNGNHGQSHECAATSEVMTGYCGSGENEDCSGGYSTRIRCCSYY